MAVVMFGAAQLVPYGRAHSQPADTVAAGEAVVWPSASSERLARAACYDCHSNETVWPWYSNVAPISWLVQHDVDSGRDEVNFSTRSWRAESDDLAEVVEEGSMPPRQYLLLHPEARMSRAEKAELIDALSSLAGDGDGGRRGRRGGDDD